MSINLSTFWTTWGVSSGDTSSTNQYDFWRGIIMDDNTQLSSQYDFFKYNNTTRYEFFNNLNSTYPEVWDEYTFYQNTDDPRIFDFDTFYTYAAQSLPGGTPPPPTFYSEDFNCTNPFNTGDICGCPTEGLTTSYLACEDYTNTACYSTFYWTGANPSEPEYLDTLYSTASLSTPLAGQGVFWLADGNGQSYQVDNSGLVVDKYPCEPLRQINLLGQFSSWSGGYVLTTTDNVNYIYSGASLPGGDVKFRQDDSWGVNWGSSDWPSGIGVQDGANIPSQEGNWLVTFNRLTGAYEFVPVLTATINPSFTIVNDNVSLYATTSYPTGAVYTWQLTDFYETATDEPITSFTGDTLPEGYFTSSGSSNVTLTIVNGIQTAVSSSFQICPFTVSGSITPSSAYTNTNVILSGSSNYDGGYVDYTWYLTDFFDASTDEPITYYNGQVLPEGYFTTTGDTNVVLYISSCGLPAQVGIDVYEEPVVPISASGGTITTYTSGGTTYKVHTFTSNGTFTVGSLGTTAGNIDVLLVAGGGYGGEARGGSSFNEYCGGGGGAGGAIFTQRTVTPTSYSLVIGAGGTSSTYNGSNTTGFSLTAVGGGSGGFWSNGTIPGANGGSGGGATQNGARGLGTTGQGNNGGTASTAQRGPGGGGGAGDVGQNGLSSGAGANGGIGIQVDITGTLLYYAGGGGAGRSNFTTGGLGGQGGGGNGGATAASDGSFATFYGGGGGGAGEFVTGGGFRSGGHGYQGVVIIRYPIGTSSAPTPPVASGLVGWYIGTDVEATGGVVDSWTDQSGNGNDLTQTVSGSKPTHNTDRVTFDGSADFMTGSTTTTMGHVFIVATPSGTQSYGGIFSTVQKHILIRDGSTNNMYFSVASIFGETTTASNMRVNETSSTVLGTTKQQYNTKGTPVSDLRLAVGKDFNGGTFASGDIYEILVYNVELSDTDRDIVENYLQTKYSL